MKNIYGIACFILMLIWCIQDETESVVSDHVEGILKILPDHVRVLLNEEPLGCTQTETFFLLLTAVIVMTWSALSACLRIRKSKKDGVENKVLKDELTTQRRIINLKQEELHKIKQELPIKQQEFLLLEKNLLSKIKERTDDTLTSETKDKEATVLQKKLSKASKQLHNELRGQKKVWKTLNKQYRKDIAKSENQGQGKLKQMEKRHQEKIKCQEMVNTELAEKRKSLERRVLELETSLRKTRGEEKYDQMCKKMENLDREYGQKIADMPMNEHKACLANKEMQRLADLHKKMKQDQFYIFNEKTQVVTYRMALAPKKTLVWSSQHKRSDNRSDGQQELGKAFVYAEAHDVV